MEEPIKNERSEKLGIDILRNVESVSRRVNEMMAARTQNVFNRYPITFALLAVFGVVAVSEGAKGVLESFGFAGHPWYLLITGLVILILTGTFYKKLDK